MATPERRPPGSSRTPRSRITANTEPVGPGLRGPVTPGRTEPDAGPRSVAVADGVEQWRPFTPVTRPPSAPDIPEDQVASWTLREKLAIVGMIAYCLFPFYWLLVLSVRSGDSGGFKLLPTGVTLQNYVDVLGMSTFWSAFTNSVIVSGSATLIGVTVGGAAAYALARLPVPGRNVILFAVLAVSMFPAISIIGPLFEMWRAIGLFDTKLGLIIPSVTFSLPLSIWIMSAFFRDLPRDLEQAAYMDGATPLQAFRMVMLPLAAPGVFTAAILVFIGTWNEFLFALSLTATENAITAPVAISQFQGTSSFEIPVGSISAASVIVMLPLVVMVLIFQRRIVGGLTAGGVKG